MLNGQKRKTGNKSAWITTGLSSFSTWLYSVMVDLKSLSIRHIQWLKETAPWAKQFYFNMRSRSVTDAGK